MSLPVEIKRKAISVVFSRDFESALLISSADHISLTHDFEFHITNGLNILEELEDIHDIRHSDVIRQLISKVNEYSVIESKYFTQWSIHISEEILDEIDFIILTHGSDLAALGMNNVSEGSIAVLLAAASIHKIRFK